MVAGFPLSKMIGINRRALPRRFAAYVTAIATTLETAHCHRIFRPLIACRVSAVLTVHHLVFITDFAYEIPTVQLAHSRIRAALIVVV
jgi:hypothetical protein